MTDYGYCCINMTLKEQRNVYVGRKMVKKTFDQKGIQGASELAEANLNDMIEILVWNKIKGIKRFQITADNARPELISHLQKKGYRIVPSKKWSGSVEDGISKLRSFGKIYIHPDCKQTAFEAKYYSYKVDKLTDAVLPTLIDKNNHCIDAIRYAIQDVIISRLLNYNKWVR